MEVYQMITEAIEMISHGYYFKDLQILQTAIDFKKAVPKHFFERVENYSRFIPGCGWRSKAELRAIRSNIIDEIINIIDSQISLPYKDRMLADNYARYLHALAILKVDKKLLDTNSDDYMRNAFLDLWQFDDGSDENWSILDSASWYISEAVKCMGIDIKEETKRVCPYNGNLCEMDCLYDDEF